MPRILSPSRLLPATLLLCSVGSLYVVGVTEGGSSGSCLLSASEGYALIGTLSNGPSHTCGADRSANTDRFASFRRFYENTDAKSYLSGTDPGNGGTINCPAVQVFKDNAQVLRDLRALRDRGLLKSVAGRQVVTAYYAAAPTMADWVRRSDCFREVFTVTAQAAAHLGSKLREPEP